MESKLNKIFKFNAAVYMVVAGDFGDFSIVKGRVVGVREYRTAYSALIYAVETPQGRFEVLPCNLYENAEEVAKDALQRVVC